MSQQQYPPYDPQRQNYPQYDQNNYPQYSDQNNYPQQGQGYGDVQAVENLRPRAVVPNLTHAMRHIRSCNIQSSNTVFIWISYTLK